MKLTPLEIKNQEFKKAMRGYDAVEVDTFLELVADKYQELLEENERLAKQNMILDNELGNVKDVEKTLKQTLKNLQENSEISKQNSQKEAGLIKKEAELAAAQLLEKTRLQVHKMREEIANLKNQKVSFISRLKHVLSSQMELLEVLETDDIDLARIKDRTKKNFNPDTEAEKVKTTKNSSQQHIKTENPEKENIQESDKKTHGKDLFNDIFGKNVDDDK